MQIAQIEAGNFLARIHDRNQEEIASFNIPLIRQRLNADLFISIQHIEQRQQILVLRI